jgi:demethylmenaquinone methyltransferase/2-methoxy-6-polyprenyl-1,4-benzoquinol methylase
MHPTDRAPRAEADRATKVEALFSRIAPRYDLINDLQSFGLHRLWKKRLVRLAEVPDQGTALDLCCGTGDIARGLASAYPRARAVVGLDFSLPMLRIAAARGAANEGSRLAYLRADALRIPAADASFDRVTVAYGLRNVAHLAGCIEEIRRVLRPGGRLIVLEFGKPRNRLASWLYFAYLKAVVPVFGKVFFGDPATYGYIHDSLVRFPSQDELAEMLRRAGFGRVQVLNPILGMMGTHIADL